MSFESCGSVAITDSASIELTGVLSVDSFDEAAITLNVSCGKLLIEGENLKIDGLDLEKGRVTAGGRINAVYYTDVAGGTNAGLLARLFGKRS